MIKNNLFSYIYKKKKYKKIKLQTSDKLLRQLVCYSIEYVKFLV